MGIESIILLVLMGLCLVSASVLIVGAVRTLQRDEKEYQARRNEPYWHQTFRADDPFWHRSDEGAYLIINDDGVFVQQGDGSRLYWSGGPEHSEGIST